MNSGQYETLERLIAFDTVSVNSDVPAMEYLADLLENAGFHVAMQRLRIAGVAQANLVAWAGEPRPGGLIISGHLDTVPAAGQPGWTRDPFRMELDGDRIHGRGASDMKGFLAQCVEAARAIDRARLKRPLVFIFTADEEVGMLGAQRVAPELPKLLGAAPRPDLAWIGEPTSFAVLNAHKSICAFEIRVRGRGGHSGAPEIGVNAIAVMGKAIEAIGRLQAERRAARDEEFAALFPESPHDVMNFGIISGGLATNIIAEECSLKVTYRSLPNRDPLELYREIERRLGGVDPHDYASENHRATIELGRPVFAPAMRAAAGSALERTLFAATGARAARGAPFATDGAWFAEAGITTLICGPGDYAQAHQPNESMARAAFERGTGMMLNVIEQMCAVSG